MRTQTCQMFSMREVVRTSECKKTQVICNDIADRFARLVTSADLKQTTQPQQTVFMMAELASTAVWILRSALSLIRTERKPPPRCSKVQSTTNHAPLDKRALIPPLPILHLTKATTTILPLQILHLQTPHLQTPNLLTINLLLLHNLMLHHLPPQSTTLPVVDGEES